MSLRCYLTRGSWFWVSAHRARPPRTPRTALPLSSGSSSLVGVWEVTQPPDKQATVRYELTAGGSALYEHYSDSSMGAGNEMITMYHIDSGRLMLTHYCMAGNQPRMLLKRFDPATGELDFDFLDATGLKDENAGHMRRAQFKIAGSNKFTSRWEFVENGKPTFDEKQELTRVSSPK